MNDDAMLIRLKERVVSNEFKTVPVVPTEAMIRAGIDSDDNQTGYERVKRIYSHMIQAAPDCAGEVVYQAARRVVAAFEANGKANNFNVNIHRECEQSMLALKAALEQTK